MRTISARDALLITLGAGVMHLITLFTAHDSYPDHVYDHPAATFDVRERSFPQAESPLRVSPPVAELDLPLPNPPPPHAPAAIPQTTLARHAPGWTIFEHLYMANGTFFVVTDTPDAFPDIQYMISTGLPAENTPENIQARMPTKHHFDVLSPSEAERRWGAPAADARPRVFPIHGNTLLFNDPEQFLDHYYHFCAELLLGAWAFWTGTFPDDTPDALTRAIFTHAGPRWRDRPNMNALFLRGAFPSLSVETDADWHDRVSATALAPDQLGLPTKSRAWRFDRVLLADRSAAFRGRECGTFTQRTASEAMRAVVPKRPDGEPEREFLPRGWWEPVRRAVLRFVGVQPAVLDRFSPAAPDRVPRSDQIVVTYISRQGVRRHLVPADHEGLVTALEKLCERRGWVLNVIQAEKYSREEQLAIASRTTYLVGVHGNGLTHLIMMPPTPAATVIELFYPGGYAHDYEWTARALGMRHFAVRNDTSTTFPDVNWPSYPEGFQGESIPVHGPYVAQLIEQRADGML